MERDRDTAKHEDLLQYLWAFVQSQTKTKIPKPPRSKSMLLTNDEIKHMLSGDKPDIPSIEEVRAALIGIGTVVVRN